MTINGSTQMTMRDPMTSLHTSRREKGVYDTDSGKYWSSGALCATELGVSVWSVYNTCAGKQKTCKGRHLSYAENVTETQTSLAKRVSDLSVDRSELERKAALWDAYQKELEKQRKEEEKRNMKIAKAKAKMERKERIYNRLKNELATAMAQYQNAERELAELEGNCA